MYQANYIVYDPTILETNNKLIIICFKKYFSNFSEHFIDIKSKASVLTLLKFDLRNYI